MPSPKRSIVLVDWWKDNEPTARSRDQFLWDLMILSLLYDEVLALDENILCSRTFPRWFRDAESFRLFEEVVDCGGIAVLKRPWQRYPKELQGLAQIEPIAARRRHLEQFSVDNHGTPLRFTPVQSAFHSRLETVLKNRPRAHRYAGSENKLGNDLMKEFGALLASVLTDSRYESWLRSKFRAITPRATDDFVRFIHEPAMAIEHLRRERPDQPPRYTPRDGRPLFDTAVAVQVAATYKDQASELQDLIETVFATPFCQDEGADGRYGRRLRDLPIQEDRGGKTAPVVSVETRVSVPLTLPWPGAGFSKIIAGVRERESGKRLRRAMSSLAGDSAFETARAAWLAVAEDIASMATSAKMKKIDLGLLMLRVGEGTLWGALTDFTLHPPTHPQELLALLARGALHGFYSLGGELYSNLRADVQRQRFRESLEASVDWACVRHPAVRPRPASK